MCTVHDGIPELARLSRLRKSQIKGLLVSPARAPVSSTVSRGGGSFRRSDTREFCRPIGLSPRVETAQGHRQHSNCQKRAEDGIRLEPPVEFVRIPQIAISHD